MIEVTKYNTSPSDMISSILSSHFYGHKTDTIHSKDTESRVHDRKYISIPAFIEIYAPTIETQYKRIDIIDISAGGMGFNMDSDSPLIVDKIRDNIPFFVLFNLPSAQGIVEVLCRPVHVASNGLTHVGASFINIPDKLKNCLDMRFEP